MAALQFRPSTRRSSRRHGRARGATSRLLLAALRGAGRTPGLEGEDVLATAAAMQAMGAEIERGDDGVWRVHGIGVGGLLQPATALDMHSREFESMLLLPIRPFTSLLKT